MRDPTPPARFQLDHFGFKMMPLLPILFIIIILRVTSTGKSSQRFIGTCSWFLLLFVLSSICFSLVLRPTSLTTHNPLDSSSTPSTFRNHRCSIGGSVCTSVALFGFKKRKVLRNEVEQSPAVEISPDLAKWAASTAAMESNDASTMRVEEEKRVIRKKRRNTNTSSSADDTTLETNEPHQQHSTELVKKLEALLQQPKRDIAQILNVIQQLTLQQSTNNSNNRNNAYLWFEGPKVRNYRMLWAGSDDAICHVGSGLHKVPLARMQEMFITVGRKRIETIEVIRILGPFPNIRNSLSGQVKVMTDTKSPQTTAATTNTNRKSIRIVYDRMVDGLGKEISAPNKERSFLLDILHVSDSAIICRVPSKDKEDEKQAQQREDLKTADIDSGSSLLILVAEKDLNAQLETLRVA